MINQTSWKVNFEIKNSIFANALDSENLLLFLVKLYLRFFFSFLPVSCKLCPTGHYQSVSGKVKEVNMNDVAWICIQYANVAVNHQFNLKGVVNCCKALLND